MPDSVEPIHFRDIAVPAPSYEAAKAEYESLTAAVDSAADDAALKEVLARWDRLRERHSTWRALTDLRFRQNTADPGAKAAREAADALTPKLTELSTAFQRRLLALDRPMLAAAAGTYPVRLWEVDAAAFDPKIVEDLQAESKLVARYTELCAAARLEVDGETVNLSGVLKFLGRPDRDLRHRAQKARWGFFEANREELDDLYDRMVRLRDGMGRKLGDPGFLPLGYRRMRRTDYGPADVAAWRAQVARDIVPLARDILERRRRALGVDRLRFWDENVADARGNPRPQGDLDWIVAQARTMYDRMDPRLGSFFAMMDDSGLMDLDTRPAKGGGGFCTYFPTHRRPFIFANFNGTKGDVKVLVHEVGHAFQKWMSRENGPDGVRPTSESAEMHSMGQEFLTFPHMDLLFGDDADRFRRVHMEDSLLFLPYGVAIDHFQHLVYENPAATPSDRHAMWQEVERRYLPWSDYGDIVHLNAGGRWQEKLHVYTYPLYYIDYTLALCVALQFWDWSRRDYAAAFDAYVALCARGGNAPFRELVAGTGLKTPFEPGALADVARAARAFLEL